MSELDESGVVLSEEGTDVVVGGAAVVNPMASKSPKASKMVRTPEHTNVIIGIKYCRN